MQEEAGIKFVVGSAFQKLEWDRASYFTAYPETDLGKPHGETDLIHKPKTIYREKPEHEWIRDTRGYYYFGPVEELMYTNMVRSLKENIHTFILGTAGGKSIKVYGSGKKACRFDQIDGENLLIINDLWDYTGLLWGNYMKLIRIQGELRGSHVLSLHTNHENN